MKLVDQYMAIFFIFKSHQVIFIHYKTAIRGLQWMKMTMINSDLKWLKGYSAKITTCNGRHYGINTDGHSLTDLFYMSLYIFCGLLSLLKVIYQPLYGMNNCVLRWGDWLSCDPLRGSHDSQSPHIRKHLCPILWQL